VYFKSDLPFEQAKEAALRATKDDGFSIQQTPEGTKGYLGDVVYTDLRSGKVSLAVAFTNNDDTLHACSPTEIKTGASSTAITLEVRLPQTK